MKRIFYIQRARESLRSLHYINVENKQKNAQHTKLNWIFFGVAVTTFVFPSEKNAHTKYKHKEFFIHICP